MEVLTLTSASPRARENYTATQAIKTWTFKPANLTQDGNVISGNLIGTDGTIAVGNEVGVLLTGGAIKNTVGGSSADLSNVISGNLSSGIELEGIGTSGNLVQFNDIGTDGKGDNPIPNPTGVLIAGAASQNTIGAGNVIAGNIDYGVHINGAGFAGGDQRPETSGNTIVGNWIGINRHNAPLSNEVGVLIDDGATRNRVGGDNQIGFNATAGIEISGIGSGNSTSSNAITNNFIGTNRDATAFIGNGIGILIVGNASNNTVGGDVSLRNVISSNLGPGVDIRGSQFSFPTELNVVSGNYIGTDGTGRRVSYPNGSGLYNPIGVLIESDASSNTIGGLNEVEPGGNVALSQGNLISGETVAGIEIRGWGSNADTTSNVISGNFIGTDVTGQSILDSSRRPTRATARAY